MKIPALASTLVLLSSLTVGCALHPAPTPRLQRSEATVRSAKAIGAADDPEASVHLRLAEQQLEQAKALILDGDNEGADWMLARATTDAELAQALALENFTRIEAAQTMEQVAVLQRPRVPGPRTPATTTPPATALRDGVR